MLNHNEIEVPIKGACNRHIVPMGMSNCIVCERHSNACCDSENGCIATLLTLVQRVLFELRAFPTLFSEAQTMDAPTEFVTPKEWCANGVALQSNSTKNGRF